MGIALLGEKLKKIRQEKGLSLEEVHKKTKIQLNILRAIEGEGLTDLSPIYLRGFLKIYCKFLGLDPREYSADYKEESRLGPHPEPVPEQIKVLKTRSFLEGASLRLGSLRPDKKIKTLAVVLLIIIIFALVLFKLGKSVSQRPKPPQVAVPAAVAQQKPLATKTTAATASFPKESGGMISLVISAKENCLVSVKVDGRVVLHRVMEKGRSDSWKAKEKIELSLGNATAVELIVNGQRFTRLGRKGQQLKNIIITEKDGLKLPR